MDFKIIPYQELDTTHLKSKGNQTMVIIHGITSSAASFQAVAEHYHQLKYNVHLIDLPLHGKSINQTHIDKNEINIKLYASMVASYIVSHELTNVFLLGHSMGGAIICIIASLIPEKIKLLILEDPLNPSVKDNLVKTYSYQDNKFNKDKLMETYRWINNYINEKKTTISKAQSILFRNIVSAPSIETEHQAILRITCPIVLIMGSADKLVLSKKTIPYFQNIIKVLHTHVIEGAEHSPHISHQKEYLEILDQYLVSPSKWTSWRQKFVKSFKRNKK